MVFVCTGTNQTVMAAPVRYFYTNLKNAVIKLFIIIFICNHCTNKQQQILTNFYIKVLYASISNAFMYFINFHLCQSAFHMAINNPETYTGQTFFGMPKFVNQTYLKQQIIHSGHYEVTIFNLWHIYLFNYITSFRAHQIIKVIGHKTIIYIYTGR